MVRECLQAAGIGCEITTYTQSRNLLYDITDDAFFYDLRSAAENEQNTAHFNFDITLA